MIFFYLIRVLNLLKSDFSIQRKLPFKNFFLFFLRLFIQKNLLALNPINPNCRCKPKVFTQGDIFKNELNFVVFAFAYWNFIENKLIFKIKNIKKTSTIYIFKIKEYVDLVKHGLKLII